MFLLLVAKLLLSPIPITVPIEGSSSAKAVGESSRRAATAVEDLDGVGVGLEEVG